ncbi:diguanylate cyclase [Halanaerobium salsuginis]|jgi:diguanylate cyclase (GGDEF)-like protein|uniref:Diguanylate cyclase (GGDEF) domain-containing protein n=1 Tax=Halanaerobium salsuginis TaxID=29563 RepID=A0A1I4I3J7_9FIRM|nr:diguanylate cyclase [Halanaerobium salsuginis]SFL48336.1 diguanylate cyclase (GGDEF) domain-containing protein [Halanaerobium salsuginis]
MKLFKQTETSTLLGLLALISIIILLINLVTIYSMVKVNEVQNRVIDIAGRQRMLSQKISKEVLLKIYTNYPPEKLLNTTAEFQSNLQILCQGSEELSIPILKDERISLQLQEIRQTWFEFERQIQILINDGNTYNQKKSAVAWIIANNQLLLNETDRLISLYEKKSIKNLFLLIQLIIFVVGTIIILVTLLISNRIAYKSGIDNLTSIYNREKLGKLMSIKIKEAYKNNQSLSLIMFDIDDFKVINDTFGHNVGDQILIEVADLVSRSIRRSDILARWGGEEFLVLAPSSNLAATIRLAERLRENLDTYYFKQVDHVTCSFGVTELQPDDDIGSLIERADQALYRSKNNGKNQVSAC